MLAKELARKLLKNPNLEVVTLESELNAFYKIDDELVIGDSYVANMAFHKNAFQLVARPAAGGDSAVDEMLVQDPVTGLIFRVAVYEQYMQTKIELQICWGIQVVKPEFLAILLG